MAWLLTARPAHRRRYLVGVALLALAAALLLPPVPQPVRYHDFADDRALLGIDNLLDVASNAGFLVVGIVGLVVCWRTRASFAEERERWPYALFFASVLVTAFGSAYYHLAPDNERLFWDRVPMAVAFMSLVAAQIVDRIDVRAGLVLLLPMSLAGVAIVAHWRMTERAGAGNVVPYAVLQASSLLLLLLIAAWFPSRYTHANAIYAALAVYAIAKACELLDDEILALGHVVSGHTAKHLVAALACCIVCRMLMQRRLREQAPQ